LTDEHHRLDEDAPDPEVDLFKMVSAEDWQWRPAITRINLPFKEIYERIEARLEAEVREHDLSQQLHGSKPRSSAIDRGCLERQLSEASKLVAERRAAYAEAMMSLVAFDKKPLYVGVHSWLSPFGLGWLTNRWADLWYRAVGWEFGQWHTHIWKLYVQAKYEEMEADEPLGRTPDSEYGVALRAANWIESKREWYPRTDFLAERILARWLRQRRLRLYGWELRRVLGWANDPWANPTERIYRSHPSSRIT